MDNKVKVMSGIAATVVGTSIVATNVNADEVVNVATQPETVVENAKTKTVTETQVSASQEQLNIAKQNVENQAKEVESAQVSANTAQNVVTEAQNNVDYAEGVVAQSNPETIAKAEQDIVNQKDVINQANDALENANITVTSKEAEVVEQNNIVSEKAVAVQLAETDVMYAQSEVDTAQSVLDGSGQAEVIAAADKASVDLNTAETVVAQSYSALELAKANDTKAEVELSQVVSTVQSNQVSVSSTQENLDEANQKQIETSSALELETSDVSKAQAVVDGLNSEIANHNTIVLPAGYADELRRFYLAKVAERDNASLTAVAKSGLNSNVYKSNAKDQSILIADVNNLTLDQREELTRFTVDLLNQVREAMGTQQVFANESAIAFANEVANTSVNTGIEALNHDTTAIPTAANKYGLSGTVGQNGYENLSVGHYTVSDTLTMDDLKKAVYTTISNMLFDDGDSIWGHSTSLTGIRDLFANQPVSKYIGVDTSVINYMNYDLGRIHILGVSDKQVTDTVQFDVTANLSGRDLQSELAAAKQVLQTEKAQLATVTTLNNNAVADKLAAQQLYNTAVATLQRNQSLLSQLQAREAETPKALDAYNAAVAARDSAKNAYDVARAALANLTADVQTKKLALEKAQETLNLRQEELSNAKTGLANEEDILRQLESELVVAKNVVATRQEELSQAQNREAELVKYVNDLKNAPQLLAEAKLALENAEKDLAEKLSILEAKQDKLALLEAVQADTEDQHAKIVAAYQAVLAAQEASRKAEEALNQQKLIKETTNGVKNLGNVLYGTNLEVKNQAQTTSKNPSSATFTLLSEAGKVMGEKVAEAVSGDTESNGSTLPNTGDTTGLLSMVGVMLMSTVGVLTKRKHQK